MAIEGQLIDRAVAGYEALAERESAREGDGLMTPMAAVRAARGEEFAAKVERRAAVLASHLGSVSAERREALEAEAGAEIDRDGLEAARFDPIARAVALEHEHNLRSERQMALAPEPGAEPALSF